MELIGGAIGAGACAAVRQGNKIFTIADDIPLLHFLSGEQHSVTLCNSHSRFSHSRVRNSLTNWTIKEILHSSQGGYKPWLEQVLAMT